MTATADKPAAQLELLDDVGDLLKPMYVSMLLDCCMRNNQERGPFEQNNFISFADGTEFVQVALQRRYVGNERVHDVGPGHV